MLKDTKETYYGCGPSTPFLIKPWDVEHQQYIAHWEQQYDCNYKYLHLFVGSNNHRYQTILLFRYH